MSQESKNTKQLATATMNGNTTNVDTLSTDMSKISLSNKGGDILPSVDGGSGGGEEMISSSVKMDTSHEHEVVERANTADNIMSSETDTVSDSIGGGVDISIEDKLFQNPPPKEDCQICFLPMTLPFDHAPNSGAQPMYQPCCGKSICNGCMITSVDEMIKGNIKKWCPYCRIPMYRSRKEYLERFKKRMDLNDAEAFYELGQYYTQGGMTIPQDMNKGFQLLNRAAELGSTNAHAPIAVKYLSDYGSGQGDQNLDKAVHHYKLAAIGGNERARHNLGRIEYSAGNMDRSMKHFMIAARSGFDDALKKVGEGYKAGHVTKDDYANTLRVHKASQDELKSVQRTEAGISTAALNKV
jgi:hypothetical protein